MLRNTKQHPAVQAGIMYGKNDDVPGFRFVDKKAKKQHSFGHPNHVKEFEKKHFSGIIQEGSSYSNHFSGGASRSILTMSTITKNKRFRTIQGKFHLAFLVPSPIFPAQRAAQSFCCRILHGDNSIIIDAGPKDISQRQIHLRILDTLPKTIDELNTRRAHNHRSLLDIRRGVHVSMSTT